MNGLNPGPGGLCRPPVPSLRKIALVLALAVTGVGSASAGGWRAHPVGSVDLLPPGQDVSDAVIELAGWVVASGDNQGYPFAIMDKGAAQVLVFNGRGRLRAAAPALFGSAVGDHIAPGIAGLPLSAIPDRDRTTPAGRFVGSFGPSADGEKVLWVDYEAAVSIHPTATGVPSERRVERLKSPTPDDNRISHGCINVAPGFYATVLEPVFDGGGVFYILPDVKPLAEVFPDFAHSRATAQHSDEDLAATPAL